MEALDIACRACAAQSGKWCVGTPALFHGERIEDAAAMTRVADPVSVGAFNRAAGARI